MQETNRKPHVVIIPSPGMGHLIPVVEFAKLLHHHHHFSISLLLPSSSPPTTAQTTFLSSLPPAISPTFLPCVDSSLLPSNVAHEVTIHLTHFHSLSHVRSVLSSLSNVVALVTDLFGTDYFDVAREFNIPPYIYFTSNAFCLLSFFYFPKLHETVSCEYRDMAEPLVMPGCVPLYGKDFVDPAQDRQDEAYRVFFYQIKRYVLAEGIFVNSFLELEPGAIDALKTEDPNRPEIYPIGPIIKSGLGGEADECLSWLDQQPPGSVLFVCFGSGGTLSNEQINELAIGLENSGQRFLWVIRAPSNSSVESFFTQGSNEDNSFGFLPEGYLDRIKNRGFLVPSWAPQLKVLSHKSTGGFLSHCGWNSTLESIVYGVPMIAWPLYAEQRMNAVLLNEGIKVALRPKVTESGVVDADEIARVVKELLEGGAGKKARERIKELSELARKTTSEDGDSTKILSQVAQKWSQHSKVIN
ncbi:UDP-glycosyltransferase 72B1-like [Chenopodium quinoa]|uniref:Glycosyltransferase n=1 Tax=Chenopodium quinoa TaxID=63459 RepID=A0A803M4W3_CHEQI|nr:UDP-glycosyltransferase 72B1-like [Chenopodium quinoa]